MNPNNKEFTINWDNLKFSGQTNTDLNVFTNIKYNLKSNINIELIISSS